MGDDWSWLPLRVRPVEDGCQVYDVAGAVDEMEGDVAVGLRTGVLCMSCDPWRALGVSTDCWDSACDSGDSQESVRSVRLPGVDGRECGVDEGS